jgi:predicted acetyltransferase
VTLDAAAVAGTAAGTDGLVLGALGRDELPQLRELVGLAFGGISTDQEWERDAGILELDRSIAARRDGVLAGHTSAYTLTMTVPSGRTLPVAGVTWVAVSPAHRRRGILTALMVEQLRRLAEHGEPVAALWASESAIYGRFGYGQASRYCDVEVPRPDSQLRPVEGSGALAAAVRVLDDAQRARCADLYTRCVLSRPGMVHREGERARKAYDDLPEWRHGASDLRCLLVTDAAGQDQAYAVYNVNADWRDGRPVNRVNVRELVAATPAAHHRLLATVLDLDLSSHTRLDVPPDDPLFALLHHPRAPRIAVRDQLWVRLVDLPAALSARTYSTDVDVVLDVTDELLPRNAGRWRLRGGSDGGQVTTTSASADLALDVRELGAAYLGEPSLAAAGRAGLVAELRPGALDATSRAFVHDPRPYVTFVF